MAPKMDLSRLRDQTMDSGQDEEAVTVNTRALVDKILARYSGEYTTIRELIQNAADARAAKVTIRLETTPSRNVPVPQTADQSALLKHTLQHHTMSRIVVSNNGEPFGDADWARLKRIAEGNPDETKIGAFGVGFYSVFADCEEPFVVSGRRTMAFYWKHNSLFTKSGQLPADQSTSDTQFLLNYRNDEASVPDLLSLSTFLTTSLTFVDLEAIELLLDDWTVLSLKKVRAPGVPVPMPNDINPKTQEGMMKVVSVVHQSTQIEAVWMNVIGWKQVSQWQTVPTRTEKSSQSVGGLSGLFSKFTKATSNMTASRAMKEKEAALVRAIEENLTGTSRATAFLRMSTVNVETYVKAQFARDLERATKKPPPKATRIEILTSSYHETSAFASTVSGAASNKATELFASVLTSKAGRVFIGFPTRQTTGVLCHVSAPSVIPTVEREAIDLNAESVKLWNMEMLRVAGIACRISFAGDMADLRRELASKMTSSNLKLPSKEHLDAIMPTATHIFQQYTAHDTTPDSRVGKIIQDAFWGCGSASMGILSTKGVLPCEDVRILKQKLTFLDSIPSVPEDITRDANDFIYKLYSMGYLTELTVKDMQKELEARALDEAQLSEFLKWAGQGLLSDELDAEVVRRLFSSAVANIGGTNIDSSDKSAAPLPGPARLLTLDQIECFQSLSKIPPQVPVPPNTIPFRIIKDIPRQQLEGFGWNELNVVPWLRFIVANATPTSTPEQTGIPNICFDAAFADQVLIVLSKQWETTSQSSKGTIVSLLSGMPVVPTKNGLKKPSEAYFPSVKIFDDLSTISGLRGVREKFLVALGVRKTIELNVVFERLLAKNSADKRAKWSFADLIRYFVSVRDDIPKSDLDRLRQASICPVANTSEDPDKAQLVPVTELYQPDPHLRALHLPLLKWEGQWRENMQEARFLRSLGLKPFPSAVELAHMMQKAGQAKDYAYYNDVMSYFNNHYMANGYSGAGTAALQSIPFLRAEGLNFPQMIAPANCFANPRAAVLGFYVLELSSRPHADRFGVLHDPHPSMCAEKVLTKPPKSRKEAIEVFGYLATRLPHIDDILIRQFASAPIVPISMRNDVKGLAYRWIAPKSCFLGESETYGEIFDYVTFSEEANLFLLKVGSKHEPSSLELARMLVDTPAKILGTIQEKRYAGLLRKLADNVETLKTDKDLYKAMKSRPFLLGYRDVQIKKQNGKSLLDDEDYEDDDEFFEREVMLQSALHIVLPDQQREYARFREHLLIPPEDDALEAFYESLGVPKLSSLIDSETRVGNPQRDQTGAQNYHKLITERARLFLDDYSKHQIQHDARWVERCLAVITLDSISVRVALRGYNISYREKRTAVMNKEGRNDYRLYITPRPDHYELASRLCQHLLHRPKKTDVMALEMVLLSDLRGLRSKGYNVSRILKQKETEARLVEENRKKQLEEERRLLEKAKASEARSQEQRIFEAHASGEGPPPPYEDKELPRTPVMTSKSNTAAPAMPGAFSSPEFDSPRANGNAKPSPLQKPQNFLSRLGNQLGSQFGYNSTNTVNEPVSQGGSKSGDVQRNLSSAIHACRSHESDSVFNKPTEKVVEEAKSGLYCDRTPGQNITFFRNTSSGVKVYVAIRIFESADGPRNFYSHEMPGVERFAKLLRDLVDVFGLPPLSIHVFFDPGSKSIAFNTNGALFCNYDYFKNLHLSTIDTSSAESVNALSYWFVTLCHELAHNIQGTHGAEHSFYTESFASEYFGKLMAKASKY